MSYLKGIGRYSSTSEEIEGLAVLISVQDLLKVTLIEEDALAGESVRTLSDDELNTLGRNGIVSIIFVQFVVINASIILGRQ